MFGDDNGLFKVPALPAKQKQKRQSSSNMRNAAGPNRQPYGCVNPSAYHCSNPQMNTNDPSNYVPYVYRSNTSQQSSTPVDYYNGSEVKLNCTQASGMQAFETTPTSSTFTPPCVKPSSGASTVDVRNKRAAVSKQRGQQKQSGNRIPAPDGNNKQPQNSFSYQPPTTNAAESMSLALQQTLQHIQRAAKATTITSVNGNNQKKIPSTTSGVKQIPHQSVTHPVQTPMCSGPNPIGEGSRRMGQPSNTMGTVANPSRQVPSTATHTTHPKVGLVASYLGQILNSEGEVQQPISYIAGYSLNQVRDQIRQLPRPTPQVKRPIRQIADSMGHPLNPGQCPIGQVPRQTGQLQNPVRQTTPVVPGPCPFPGHWPIAQCPIGQVPRQTGQVQNYVRQTTPVVPGSWPRQWPMGQCPIGQVPRQTGQVQNHVRQTTPVVPGSCPGHWPMGQCPIGQVPRQTGQVQNHVRQTTPVVPGSYPGQYQIGQCPIGQVPRQADQVQNPVRQTTPVVPGSWPRQWPMGQCPIGQVPRQTGHVQNPVRQTTPVVPGSAPTSVGPARNSSGQKSNTLSAPNSMRQSPNQVGQQQSAAVMTALHGNAHAINSAQLRDDVTTRPPPPPYPNHLLNKSAEEILGNELVVPGYTAHGTPTSSGNTVGDAMQMNPVTRINAPARSPVTYHPYTRGNMPSPSVAYQQRGIHNVGGNSNQPSLAAHGFNRDGVTYRYQSDTQNQIAAPNQTANHGHYANTMQFAAAQSMMYTTTMSGSNIPNQPQPTQGFAVPQTPAPRRPMRNSSTGSRNEYHLKDDNIAQVVQLTQNRVQGHGSQTRGQQMAVNNEVASGAGCSKHGAPPNLTTKFVNKAAGTSGAGNSNDVASHTVTHKEQDSSARKPGQDGAATPGQWNGSFICRCEPKSDRVQGAETCPDCGHLLARASIASQQPEQGSIAQPSPVPSNVNLIAPDEDGTVSTSSSSDYAEFEKMFDDAVKTDPSFEQGLPYDWDTILEVIDEEFAGENADSKTQKTNVATGKQISPFPAGYSSGNIPQIQELPVPDGNTEGPSQPDQSEAIINQMNSMVVQTAQFTSPFPSTANPKPEKITRSRASSRTRRACQVCGDPGHVMFTGVRVCHGCKGFYLRIASQNNNMLVCFEGGGKCDVTNPEVRNKCTYCKYKKCCAVGMRRDKKYEPKQ